MKMRSSARSQKLMQSNPLELQILFFSFPHQVNLILLKAHYVVMRIIMIRNLLLLSLRLQLVTWNLLKLPPDLTS